MIRPRILAPVLAGLVLLCSCGDDISPRPASLTGTWSGIAYGFSDIPEHPDPQVVLSLHHSNSAVSGTLKASGIERPIYSGSFHYPQLAFELRYEYDDVVVEFKGELDGNRIEGEYDIRQRSSGQLYLNSSWYVERRN